MTDHFLDLFNESSLYKMSATLILNEILAGVNTRHTQTHTGGYKSCVIYRSSEVLGIFPVVKDDSTVLVRQFPQVLL